jgi:hypothetical protein
MNIITVEPKLSYLGLGCLGLLVKKKEFKDFIRQKNLNGDSVLETIFKGLNLICSSIPAYPYELRCYLRSLHVYLLSFDRLDPEYFEIDHILSLI